MRVHFNVVGFMEHPTWAANRVDLDAVPREGEVVEVPGLPEGQVFVRTVVWYPWGDGGADPDPFVYVVLGQRRRL